MKWTSSIICDRSAPKTGTQTLVPDRHTRPIGSSGPQQCSLSFSYSNFLGNFLTENFPSVNSQPPTITINTHLGHDYCPEIIGWPAPPSHPFILRAEQKPTIAPHTLSPTPVRPSASVQTSPYVSPHLSPVPRMEFWNQEELDGSSKLLSSMLRVVAASSPNSGMFFFGIILALKFY